jgi:hypothetical protein
LERRVESTYYDFEKKYGRRGSARVLRCVIQGFFTEDLQFAEDIDLLAEEESQQQIW